MGESVGDIVYMLLMVAALVVSVIIKAKKAPQEDSPVPQSEMNGREGDDEDFSTFSDWLSGGEKKLKEEPVISSVPNPVIEKIPYERMQSNLAASYHKAKRKEKAQRSERVSQTPLKLVPRGSVAEEELESEASTWFEDSQDLRRAIIYSEILKRPTF